MVILQTKRLILREFNPADAAFILTLLNNPSWLQYIGDRKVRTLQEANNYLENGPIKSYRENGFGLSMVELKKSHTPIGICGLIRREVLENADIGYALLPEYTGLGYAFEIVSSTLEHAKNKLGLDTVVAITTANNEQSIRLLNKTGMRFEKKVQLSEDEESLMLFSTTAFRGDL